MFEAGFIGLVMFLCLGMQSFYCGGGVCFGHRFDGAEHKCGGKACDDSPCFDGPCFGVCVHAKDSGWGLIGG